MTSASTERKSAPRRKVAPPATLFLFGAAGDLVKRLLVPALYNLYVEKLVGAKLEIVGVDHNKRSDDVYRKALGRFLHQEARDKRAEGKVAFKPREWTSLAQRVSYLRGDFLDDKTYAAIAARLGTKGPQNAIFYLATAPRFFGDIVERLAKAGLLEEGRGFRRVIVEKPFGSDLTSAQALNARILKVANETQIYRIDHFLGKETVQNILVSRFANGVLEAVWNNRYIDHVQITAAETIGVGDRGRFYEQTGALRDMVPNHLFQLVSMIAMEPPSEFTADAVRAEKAKVIAAIRPQTPAQALSHSVRGQYRAGRSGRRTVCGYRDEDGVAKSSRTETFVALKLAIDNWRWAGVPFYLRTGKRMRARDAEIAICFKPAPLALFRETGMKRLPPNYLILQIQPDEGITLSFAAKSPGPDVTIENVAMSFAYADAFPASSSTGYETLLYECLMGDPTLFQSADNIETGWRVVQPFLDAWAKGGRVASYPAGTDGPAEAQRLLANDGRAWHPTGRRPGRRAR